MIDANRFRPLPVAIVHAPGMLALPDHHRDPFDRILIAQALHEGFRLVTRDQEIAKYPVPHIMA
jgi:PIN domain nuclease of toxin-antitoxin system